jgi:hypothetical protein
MFVSSRPTAFGFTKQLGCAAGICLLLVGLSTAPALAATAAPTTCAGQIFSQPFAAFEDLRHYTLVPGGEFNKASEGWTLSGGAHVTTATRPDGSTGGALDLPSGAVAVSPPMCVTLAYPTARAWVQGAEGSRAVAVSVSYANTKTAIEPKDVGKIRSRHGSWTLGEFSVAPQLAGKEEAPREVRFVFEGKRNSDNQVFDVYVDPRMR